jgi:hypothetical protein
VAQRGATPASGGHITGPFGADQPATRRGAWVVDWRDLAVSVAVLVAWFVIAPLRFVLPSNWQDYAWSAFVVQVAVPTVLFLAAIVVLVRHRRQGWSSLGFRPTTRSAILVGAAVFLVTLAFDVVLGALFRGDESPASAASSLAGTGVLGSLAVVLLGGLLTPVMEEVFFRGVLFAGVRRYWGFWAGALISAVLFAVPHGLDPIAFPSTAFAGVVYASLYERYRSIWPAIAAHALNNTAAAALAIVGS